ncbi:hypothetical protein [Propionicimonas sp.]|uniref:hypothetical protein n=1 Tax=Propionicimonas sp. TaxID=1955623 RepID=UPI0039E4B097
MSPGAASPPPREAVRRWFDLRFRSASAIYGLIVFTAFISIASDEINEAGHPIDAAEILAEAVPALLIFYAAHVYAETLTDHGEHGFGRSLRQSLRNSSGMLWSALPTIVILVIGTLTSMSGYDAYWYAMLAAVLILGVLGYAAYSRRGSNVAVRILGGLGTALLGATIILLEYAVH